jgi:hypothetical protein
MSERGPWEDYQEAPASTDEAGPWADYASSEEAPAEQPPSIPGQVAKEAFQAATSTGPEAQKPLAPTSGNPAIAALQAAMQTIKNPTRISPTVSQPGQMVGDVVKEKFGGGFVGGAAGFLTSLALDPQSYMMGGVKPNLPQTAAKEVLPNIAPRPVVQQGPSALERLAKAEGVDLSAADLTGSKTTALMESALNKLPGSAGLMQEFRKKQLDQLTKLRDKLVAAQGPQEAVEKIGLRIQEVAKKMMDAQEGVKKAAATGLVEDAASRLGTSNVPKEIVGANLQQQLIEKSKAAFDDAGRLYDELDAMMPPEAQIIPKNLINTAKTLLKEQKETSAALRDDKLVGLLNDLVNKKPNFPETLDPALASLQQLKGPQPVTWGRLKADRQALNGLLQAENAAMGFVAKGLKGQSTPAGRAYSMLKGAIQQDMDDAAQATPGLAEQFTLAKAAYGKAKETFKKDEVLKIVDSNPEKAFDFLMRPGNQTAIRNIRSIIGEPGFKPLKDRLTASILGMDSPTGFTLEGIKSAYKRFGKDTLSAVYSPKEMKDLGDLIVGLESTSKLPVGNPFLKTIVAKDPEKIIDYVIQPGNTTKIKQLKLMTPANEYREVKAAFIDKLLPKDVDGVMKFSGVVNNLSKYGKTTLSEVFTPQEVQNIEKLGALARTLQRTEQLAGNPSGTAQVQGMMSAVLHPIDALLRAIPSRALAKMYLSKEGTDLLVKGYQLPPQSPALRNIVTLLRGMTVGTTVRGAQNVAQHSRLMPFNSGTVGEE